MKKLLLFVFLILLQVSCAGLTVTRVATDVDDEKERGVRYYESSPYLLVHTDSEGGLATRLLYLPDPTKKMSARPYTYLANSSTTLNFKNGVLTSAETSVDETAIPKAVLSAIETAATAAIVAADQPVGEQHQVPPPYLFKIVINGDDIQLLGGQPIEPIQVTVPKEK